MRLGHRVNTPKVHYIRRENLIVLGACTNSEVHSISVENQDALGAQVSQAHAAQREILLPFLGSFSALIGWRLQKENL